MRGGSGSARGAAKSDQRGRPHHHHLAGSLLCSRTRSLEERGRAPGDEGGHRLLPVSSLLTPWGRSSGGNISHTEGTRRLEIAKSAPELSFLGLELGVGSFVVLPEDSVVP